MEPLAALNDLSMNFYWSWHPEGSELFRELDPSLWEKYEQNPRLLLKSVNELRLLQKSTDQEYVDRLRRFRDRFDAYTGEPAQAVGRISSDHPAAYFCAEYGVHNSLPIYSGGLGILAGDHLKSASDLNIPLVAVGLLYRYGYFRQSIGHNGWQEESYQDILGSELAITPVVDSTGDRVLTMVHLRGREVFAQAWLAQVGRISLYLLDTNIEQNAEVDRMITGHLYGGSSETRIVQEKVLGIGGVRLLRRLGISPSVFHLNEGHSAFLTLELAREYLAANPDADFLDSIPAVREQCVFTTHTPVSAGNDLFSTNEIRDCFDAGFIEALKLSEEELFELGRIDPDDKTEGFGMTPLAIRMCRSANGVSEKHGEVSRGLWKAMFPGADETADVPITHVTNGVHAPTWVAPLFQGLYRSAIGEDWNKRLADRDDWAYAVDDLSDEDIWSTHILLKRIMIAFIRERTQRAETGERDTINEHQDTRKLFSPDVLTIGFARRVAAYKRWNLMLSDIDRLLKLVDDAERPVQFVFAGKAHPQDKTAKEILQQLMSINHDSNWQRRAVFIEDYDQEVARYLVQGVDVWMNVPRRPLEASGTSGMKAAMNGALNFSILDGWWIEGYNGRNGFKIGELAAGEDDEATDAADAAALYQALEDEVIPLYYDRGKNGVSSGWIAMMKNALATLTPQFASDRMVRDYLSRIYNDA
ncbi:MAG: alpha-glucan family phosphorylase [Acidobacteria bacterium]|nr:alpha-glucan family phosphorylase [Acidobacteriota bacterium]